MSRKAFICHDAPGGVHCTTVIIGDHTDSLVERATEHMVEAHEVERTPELRAVILAALETEAQTIEEIHRYDRFDMVHPHLHPPPEEDED